MQTAPPSYNEATGIHQGNPNYQNPGYPPNYGFSTNSGYPQPAPVQGYGDPVANSNVTDDGGFAAATFTDKNVRHAFIRKVYLILMAQLSVTFGFVAICQFVVPIKVFIQHNSWFYYLSYATFICTYIALVCCRSVSRRYPGNFIALSVLTLALSYMTGTIASFYSTISVLVAVGITTGVCLSVSIFSCQTRFDFTTSKCMLFMFVFCIVVLLFGFTTTLVYLCVDVEYKTAYVLHCVYGSLAALLFALYLAYDTQMIMGGRKHELSEEEYVYGALTLYMDIVNLFLIMLSLFGSRN